MNKKDDWKVPLIILIILILGLLVIVSYLDKKANQLETELINCEQELEDKPKFDEQEDIYDFLNLCMEGYEECIIDLGQCCYNILNKK